MDAGQTPIPKIIHQIWLGTNPIPTEWMKTVEDFADKYGYKYMLWKESSIGELGIDEFPGLSTLYDTFKKHLAGKADIIRLLVLYKYGGVYIDADTVIMKPEQLNAFLEKNRAGVFFGWEKLTSARTKKLGNVDSQIRNTRKMIANGIIGSAAKHPFLKKLLLGAAENVQGYNTEERMQPWRVIGPHYVTRAYHATRKEFPDIHVYPMKYFYPLHWGGITDPELHKKVKIPKQSMMFQYGYTTNSFDKIFKNREGRKTRRRSKTTST